MRHLQDSRGKLTTGGGGLARVDVSDDNDVDVSLFLTVGVVRKTVCDEVKKLKG